LVVIFDEATAFKNTSTKTFDVCQMLSVKSKRCYGLTATLLKNNLMEGYSIFRVVVPNVFSTKTKFMDTYAVVRQMPIKGGRMIPLVVGYKNLNLFRKVIDPYFLGRSKHMVSDELPTLITKEVICEMSPVEDRKYSEALSGILELGDGTTKEYEESKALVALIYCQQVVNSLSMLKFQGGDEILTGIFQDEVVKVEGMGAKEAALIELLTGELEGDKVIIYTRFESLVGRLQMLLKDEKIKSTRITGKESGDQRKINQDAFQDADSDTKVIFITDAGSEAINLQTASALIFFDAPWSWGNYVQTLGRPVRIGSVHNHVTVYHLIAERPRDKAKDRKTIDHHVLDSLRGKKRLSDAVLGEAAVGALTFDKEKSGTKELVRRLQGKVGVEEKADA
jgi:SNF2 family DNA or RNA helicase